MINRATRKKISYIRYLSIAFQNGGDELTNRRGGTKEFDLSIRVDQ